MSAHGSTPDSGLTGLIILYSHTTGLHLPAWFPPCCQHTLIQEFPEFLIACLWVIKVVAYGSASAFWFITAIRMWWVSTRQCLENKLPTLPHQPLAGVAKVSFKPCVQHFIHDWGRWIYCMRFCLQFMDPLVLQGLVTEVFTV